MQVKHNFILVYWRDFWSLHYMVGNSPDEAKEGAKNPKTAFLVDHWAYNDKELVKLLELLFHWKSQNVEERDIVLIGGCIHIFRFF